MGSLTRGLQISIKWYGFTSMLFFGNLHTLSLHGMQNISGFVRNSILNICACATPQKDICVGEITRCSDQCCIIHHKRSHFNEAVIFQNFSMSCIGTSFYTVLLILLVLASDPCIENCLHFYLLHERSRLYM